MTSHRKALLDIINVLGPDAPDHEDVCDGCQHEIGEALDIARAALAASATDERNRRLSEAMTTPAPPSTSRLAASATDEGPRGKGDAGWFSDAKEPTE